MSSKKPAVVLLVEDDPGDQVLTRRAFERSDCDLRLVADGEEALDYLLRRGDYLDERRSPRPDLILLDLNLPKIDGQQVLRTLRAQPALRRIVVVVLTTSTHEEDIQQAYACGANSYITKPSTMEGLFETIARLEQYWFDVATMPRAGM